MTGNRIVWRWRSLHLHPVGVVLLLTAALAAPGCGLGVPDPADPEQARAALRSALDAWKEGAAPDSLKGQRPAIHVSDQDWSGGMQLLGYEILADQPFGADLRCRVRLALQNGRGQAVRKIALYGVGTSPVLTVLRTDEEP
jgi:hypothetical protein